jgi:hypothetical protein
LRAIGLADESSPSNDIEPISPEPGLADQASAQAQPDDAAVAAQRRDILERLARRELSAEEAAAAIRSLGGN